MNPELCFSMQILRGFLLKFLVTSLPFDFASVSLLLLFCICRFLPVFVSAMASNWFCVEVTCGELCLILVLLNRDPLIICLFDCCVLC